MKALNIYHSAVAAIAMFVIAMGCSSCSEIEDGTTDIDLWELPKEEITIPNTFVHPGIPVNMEQIENMRKTVQTQRLPQYKSYQLLLNDNRSNKNYNLQGPFEELYTGEDATHPSIVNALYNDWNAAVQTALLYAVTNDEDYAKKSLEILLAYSDVKKPISSLSGNLDHVLMAANEGIKLVYATELLRYLYPQGMTDDNFNKICNMLKRVVKPVLDDFFALKTPTANGNFGAGAVNCYMAMGVLFDDVDMYKMSIDNYLYKYDDGCIRYYIDSETGQCLESGRDQTHTQLGLGLMGMVCETAWTQGTDLYKAYDNLLLKGLEYTAKYNLGHDVPFKVMNSLTNKYHWTEIDFVDKQEIANGQRDKSRRGIIAPIWERAYNHYVKRQGLSAPYITDMVLTKARPEGFDNAHLGFGTFIWCNE